MKKLNINFIIGLFFILAGILLCLQFLNIDLKINTSIIWWGLLAVAGVIVMINDRKVSIVSSIMIVFGIWNVLRHLDIVSGSAFNLIWPLILVVVGVNMLFSNTIFPKRRTAQQEKDGILVYNGIFGGVEERLTSKEFKGLNANAIFGAVELDLRDIEVKDKEVYLNLSTMFGGITVIVPTQYNIVSGENFGMFGGTENKCKKEFQEEKNTIYINSRAIFGGIEIK